MASLSVRVPSRRRGRRRNGGQGRLQARLGVDQEVGGGDDALASGDAAQDLHAVGDLGAHPDLARLQAAGFQVDEHECPFAGLEDCALRHHETGPEADLEDHIGEHLGLELSVSVVDFDAHLDGSRLLIDHGRDVGHGPAPGPPRQVRQRQLGRRSHVHRGQVGLVHVGEHPEMTEVCDVEQRVHRRHAHPVDRHLLGDVAADR